MEGLPNRRDFLKAAMGVVPALAQSRRPEMVGTPPSMDRQDLIALVEDLTPIADIEQLDRFVKKGLLVTLPENAVFTVADNLEKQNRAYCRPWTLQFLNQLSKEWSKKFPHKKILISSAVRPKSLGKVNDNASPRSTHPTGNTIDLYYADMDQAQNIWMQDFLTKWEKIIFTKEINLKHLTIDQKKWFSELTKARRASILRVQDKTGRVRLDLPSVEATREESHKCFHLAVSQVVSRFIK